VPYCVIRKLLSSLPVERVYSAWKERRPGDASYNGTVQSSSTSTYIDLTKAASAASEAQSAAPAADVEGEVITESAKVLAAIHAGAQLVAELREKTGLGTDQIVSILAGLSQSGLVQLEDDNGTLRATLTEATKVALSS
jgi:hypothetical protein